MQHLSHIQSHNQLCSALTGPIAPHSKGATCHSWWELSFDRRLYSSPPLQVATCRQRFTVHILCSAIYLAANNFPLATTFQPHQDHARGPRLALGLEEGLALLEDDDETLDSLVDAALGDEHERGGEGRLEELGANTGVQACGGYQFKDSRSEKRPSPFPNAEKRGHIPEIPSVLKIWRTALTDELYL